MSHTTKIEGVPITDIGALRAAVNDLANQGVKFEMLQGVKPRMFYKDQHGTCDYVVKLPGKYDIGFDKQADGSYKAVMDNWANEVSNHLGAACPMPNTPEGRNQHAVGRLLQEYAKHAAINAARAKGYSIMGTTRNAAGDYQLQIAVPG